MNKIFEKLTSKIENQGPEVLLDLIKIFPTPKLKLKFLNLYRQYLLKKLGYVEVEIITARKLNYSKLINLISKLTSLKPLINFSINSRILGGFQIIIGDKIYDASLINFIKNLWKR